MNGKSEFLEQLESQLAEVNHLPRTREAARQSKAVIAGSAPAHAGTPEILSLVQRIFLSDPDQGPRQVVFCGVDEPNGSTLLCAEVARCLAAHVAQPVCILNANRASTHISALLGIDSAPIPAGRHSALRVSCVQAEGDLWLAVPPSSGAGGDIKETLAQLHGRFEYVLIDVAGALVHGDAIAWGSAADALILVIEAHATRREAARKVKQSLDAAGIRILGTVLRDRSLPIPEALYRRL